MTWLWTLIALAAAVFASLRIAGVIRPGGSGRLAGSSSRAVVGWMVVLAMVGLATLTLRAEEPRSSDSVGSSPTKKQGEVAAESTAASAKNTDEVKPPKGWPKRLPLPLEKTNCVRCHLNAGRELTLAVRDFAHSVHDLNHMSCNDCHGGNTDNDALAHDESVGFIGTKLSAHLRNCAECHEEEHALLASGPHAWDFSKRINTDYPMCIDCHGNHDVGNPPPDFRLKDVCLDCHEKLDEEHPAIASVVDQNDKYWVTMIAVREKRLQEEDPVPPEFRDRVDRLRHATMQVMHGLHKLPQKKADQLNQQVEALRQELEAWLKNAQ